MILDTTLYFLIDPDQTGGHDPVALTRAAVSGGVTLVQLRDKGTSTRRAVDLARALIDVLAPRGVPLVVNDRVDVALAAGAQGVHVGQDDMDPRDARRLLGPRAIIGQTVKSLAHVEAVPIGAVDYVGVGGVFATTSKVNPAAPIGLDGLAACAARMRARAPTMHIAAIAGIDLTNAGDVVRADADGVCVISAIAGAKDPSAAARALREVVDAAKPARTINAQGG